MSPEAEILTRIDTLAGLVTAPATPDSLAALGRETSQLVTLATALEMAATAQAASGVERAARAGESLETLGGLLDRLQQSADTELAQRLAGQPAPLPPSSVALPPEFTSEAREHLEAVEQQLLALEANPSNTEAIHAIFRAFHTIKGLAAIFEIHPVRDLAHAVETLLDQVRQGKTGASPALIDLALESKDRIGAMIASPGPGDAAARELAGRIARFSQPEAAPAFTPMREGQAGSAAAKTATMRIETSKLDHLVDLVGELLIAQSMVAADPLLSQVHEPRLARNLAQVARMTAELQRAAMAMRLVPLGPAFQRLARAFRDLLRATGKQARLEIEGESLELDRTILEQLADPLLHMVRNAVDHGLETPDERSARGKNAEGTLRLAASHQSGNILIEVSDDGRGLDTAAIARRAAERGLVPEGAELSKEQMHGLIFEPGFTTAGRVTDLSGRGVGMDVVRRQIEKLRGRVEIHSESGRGTTFLLRLPLTLAIIDGLIVHAGGQRYILPLFSVHEIVRPAPGSIYSIENRSEVIMLRDSVLPALRLTALLGVNAPARDPADCLFVVTDHAARRYALMVDRIEGKQQVVIKSLGNWFGHRPGIAGAAILGDGSVGLILDLEGLIGGASDGAAA